MLAKVLAMLFLLAVQVVLYVAVFTYGWGLTARDWRVIAACFVAQTALRVAADAVSKSKVARA